MNRNIFILIITVVSITLAMGACGGKGKASTSSPTPIPGASTMVQGMPVERYYSVTCAPCHGASRRGIVGPALRPDNLKKSDVFYNDTIRKGRPGTSMPEYGKLSDGEIKALINYIKYTQSAN